MSEAPRARNCGVDPVRELHNGQRRVKSRINRPDTRKHLDYAALPSKNLLAFEGASTHGHWPTATKAVSRSLRRSATDFVRFHGYSRLERTRASTIETGLQSQIHQAC